MRQIHSHFLAKGILSASGSFTVTLEGTDGKFLHISLPSSRSALSVLIAASLVAIFPSTFSPQVSSLDPASETIMHIYYSGLSNPWNPFRALDETTVSDPSSPERFLPTLKAWIDVCAEDHFAHPKCTGFESQDDVMPGRLIKIGTSEILSLVAPTEQVRFAALSYCWGLCDQLVTTKANVELRYNSFESSGFPQTLKDAILMTGRLELEFLWIDSLCIVQDDSEDWAAESVKMGSIFMKAHVVLAATKAKDVTEGFLQRQQPLVIASTCNQKPSVKVLAKRVDNQKCVCHPDPEYGHLIETLPLSQRAWAYQERLLATRTLHFMHDEVVFECTPV